MNHKRIPAILLVIVLLMGVLSACTSAPTAASSSSGAPSQASGASAGASTAASADSAATSDPASRYPIPGDVTLSYFGRLHSKIASDYSSYADLDVVKWWFEQTGVTLDFQTPPSGMEEEQFNIMLASGDYTDLISYDLAGEPGGLQKLYQDGVIIEITDYMAEFTPNLVKFYQDRPEIDKQVKDDNGKHFVIPFLKGGGYLLATSGHMIREDILTEVGAKTPETISEWTTALEMMKAAYPDSYPLIGRYKDELRQFQGAWDIGTGNFYSDMEGVVQFAPADPKFKEFLATLNSWYAAGYIDPNMATLDKAAIDNAMSSGNSFATYGAGSSSLGAYMNANLDDPTFLMIGVRPPTQTLDELSRYVTNYEYGGNPQIGITTKCENVEAALMFYDFCFSDEAYRRFNWGIEGESYTIDENGIPRYTDLILNNPDGLAVDTILAKYAMTAIKAPAAMVQDPEYIVQYYNMPGQQQAMDAWMQKDFEFRALPKLSYTAEESSELTAILADLETYIEQMSMKFVLGTESLDNFDDFVATCESMRSEDARVIQQAAMDRYNLR